MLTVLGGLAEFERHLIRARTREGRYSEFSFERPISSWAASCTRDFFSRRLPPKNHLVARGAVPGV
jgi:hypothetical protein